MSDITKILNTDPKKSCILIVDDEAANVRLLEKILTMTGYSNVICTQDPTQVVPLYQHHDCDLILLDIDMPILDGFGVMAQLNELTNNTPPPILVLTAQHMQSFRQRALDNGARDYVTKPFDASELLSRVRNLLDVQMAHRLTQHQNALLEQKVRERTQIIYDTRLQVVRCLGRAAEYRDEETGLHIIRMSKISALLGKAARLDDEQSDRLLNAAPMHDIGKIGIPDEILLKPGKFTPEEWEIMKTHAQIGADILAGNDSDLMIMAHDIALTHHEKWNGTGYPNGLKGEEIPLVGRICALADVFDALTSTRPYKKAWSVEKSINLIKSESGQHFDPLLVDLFLKNLPAIIEIKEKYGEPE
ncbi:MAG: two-component system response regulator [Alphaproteobacteria bacterium]|nr:MAG: two-component system response regulator [Alphaproteobacteria bacterium]